GRAGGGLLGLEAGLTLLGELTRLALVLHHLDVLAGFAHSVEAEDLHGGPGGGLVHPLALVVEHGSDLAPDRTGDDGIAHVERAALNEDSGDRPAGPGALGLDTRCVRARARSGAA